MLNYLVVEDFSGREVPFIFPERVAHEEMRNQLPYGRIISGGRLSLGRDGFVCTGASPDLGVQARPSQDSALIAESLAN